MITEDYVSFETAKLLKEKGFDEFTYACFTFDGDDLYGYRAVGDDIMRPTLQMAMKWLEEKGIAIIPVVSSILDNKTFLWDIRIVVAKTGETFDTYSQGWIYEKREEACDAAIKYSLENLI